MKYERSWMLTDREGNKNYHTIINYRLEEDMRKFLFACGYDSSLFIVESKKDKEIYNNQLLCNFEFYNFDTRRPLTFKIITNPVNENYDVKFY